MIIDPESSDLNSYSNETLMQHELQVFADEILLIYCMYAQKWDPKLRTLVIGPHVQGYFDEDALTFTSPQQ